MMLDVQTLRRVSELANDIIVAIIEARGDASLFRGGGNQASYGPRFVRRLYDIESAVEALHNEPLWAECLECFARVNVEPVATSDGFAEPSEHAAAINQGRHTGGVAFDVARSALPTLYSPGVEYPCPRLFAEADILGHVDAALESFDCLFASEPALHAMKARMQQELARAIATIEASPPLTPTDARAKFCYEEWQRGQTYKAINAALDKHAEWESYDDPTDVRSAIRSWANRFDPPLLVRKGQPGRRTTK